MASRIACDGAGRRDQAEGRCIRAREYQARQAESAHGAGRSRAAGRSARREKFATTALGRKAFLATRPCLDVDESLVKVFDSGHWAGATVTNCTFATDTAAARVYACACSLITNYALYVTALYP